MHEYTLPSVNSQERALRDKRELATKNKAASVAMAVEYTSIKQRLDELDNIFLSVARDFRADHLDCRAMYPYDESGVGLSAYIAAKNATIRDLQLVFGFPREVAVNLFDRSATDLSDTRTEEQKVDDLNSAICSLSAKVIRVDERVSSAGIAPKDTHWIRVETTRRLREDTQPIGINAIIPAVDVRVYSDGVSSVTVESSLLYRAIRIATENMIDGLAEKHALDIGTLYPPDDELLTYRLLRKLWFDLSHALKAKSSTINLPITGAIPKTKDDRS